MSLLDQEFRKNIAAYIRDNHPRVELNGKLFDILEGSLKPLLEEKMVDDLGRKSASAAMSRLAPINYYRKVIDKMTSIYNHGVTRKVVDGTEQDQELVDWYVRELGLNTILNNNNEALNAYKYSLLQITLTDPNAYGTRKPFSRTIPNHQFLVMNTSKVDPTSGDVVILFMGKKDDEQIYHVYSDDEFVIINSKGDIKADLMAAADMDGSNPYGSKPFMYANKSQNLVMPKLQVDDLEMALLVPLLLTDLNYAAKFQAFSMFVATDIDAQDIEISPNVVLHLKSDPTGDKPSFTTIKPDVDISEVLSLSASEISLWLSSKGIRPGALAQVGPDQFSSGISKMIDESDTYESRMEQIELYKDFEADFWDKLLKVMHPIWVASGLIDNRTIFSPSASVVTTFKDPQPLKSRIEVINEVKELIDNGLESRKGALKTLFPDWDDDQIEAKLQEIDDEAKVKVAAMMETMQQGVDDERPTSNQDESEDTDRPQQ